MSATSSLAPHDSVRDAATTRTVCAASLVGGLFVLPLGLLLLSAPGCGGGPPRKALPPSERRAAEKAIRRERFQILGARDDWADTRLVVDRLERMGGVLEVDRDLTEGRFIVVYNPQRTHRDAIVQRVAEIGDEVGRGFEALFDDR